MAKKDPDLKVEDLREWMGDASLLYASDHKVKKSLFLDSSGKLNVLHDGNTIYIGKELNKAVEAYNEITQIWINPIKDFKL